MFYSKDEVEIRKLVTFYTVYTCIYFPILILTLVWSESIYSIGKYHFRSVLIIIVVAEMAKYFASLFYFRINDINLSKKHDDKTLRTMLKSLCTRSRIKEGLKTLTTVAIMTSVYFLIAILYGAEVFGKYEETFMFSLLLSILTIFPTCMNLGSHFIISFLLGNKPNDLLESLIFQNLYFTVFGAWLGAFVIPLDWDRPWQEWPIPCSSGAMVGFTLSHMAMICQIGFSRKKKVK